MASIIRIKRSSVSGNPATLGAGELAYSALTDNGSNGGDRLYIGIGSETAGNAANHFVIGGKYFTDMLDQTPGTLTASSAIIVDSNSKINNLNVGNLTLTGSTNTISSTDTNGNIVLTPNGTGKTVLNNPYINGTTDTLAEFIYDTVGGAVTAGTGITVTNSDGSNTSTVAIDSTVATLTGSQALTNKTVNGLTITSSTGTLTIANGKTLTASNTLTLTGTDSASVAFGAGGTVAYVANKLSVFAATSSAELAGVISDETGSGALVFASSPTLVTPTLGAALATSITATSGNLTIAAAAGNNSVSITPTGTGTVDVASKRITSVADPSQAQDAATKAYVDSMSNGLDVKASVRAASTAALTVTYSNGSSGVGATLTNAGTQAALTLDSIALSSGDRVLIKDQASALQNGVYTVTTVGTVSTNWVLTRATDFDNSPGTEVSPGVFFFVEEGTTQQDNGYVVSTDSAITIGTTAIVFSQFSGAGQITAGDGLTKSGNTINAVGTSNRISISADAIDISTSYVGQTSITTLGTITTGTWNGSVIGATYGGTGVNNGASTITLGGSFTHTGAHTLGVTTTANTSVTLPTTGTLATLAGTESLSNKTITSSSFSGTTLAASGAVTLTSATDASALGTAAVVLSGGLSVAKAMFIGTNITGAGAATSTLDGFNIDGGTY
jgi:hypothetical protein